MAATRRIRRKKHFDRDLRERVEILVAGEERASVEEK